MSLSAVVSCFRNRDRERALGAARVKLAREVGGVARYPEKISVIGPFSGYDRATTRPKLTVSSSPDPATRWQHSSADIRHPETTREAVRGRSEFEYPTVHHCG